MTTGTTNGTADDARIDWIRRYAGRHTSRSHPVFFAGRDAEMERLEGCFHYAMRGQPGAITTICGIPGAGKSSLARQFRKRIEASFGAAVVVRSGPAALADPVALAQAMVRAQHTADSSLPPPDFALDDGKLPFAELLERAGALRDIGVVLIVDEAQMIDFRACLGALVEMHQAECPMPILPLFIGLPQLRQRLGDASMTRLDPGGQIDLGPMSLAAAERCIRESCRSLGVEAAVARRLGAQLAPPTGGFAAHVDAAVAGVALVMQRHGFALQATAANECVTAARSFREAYYETRIENATDMPREVLEIIAAAVIDPNTGLMKRGVDEGASTLGGARDGSFTLSIFGIADDCQAAIDRYAKIMPHSLDLDRCLRSAENAGILEYRMTRAEIRFPAAPSMARHVLGLREPEVEAALETV